MSEMPAPDPAVALRNSLLMEPPVISVSQTSLVPRRVFEQVGGFDVRLSTSADTDLACRIAVGWRVAAVKEPLVLYRQHADQMHRDPDAMYRDMTLVLGKFFASPDLPADIARLKRRAVGNLHATLAVAHARSGSPIKGLRHGFQALGNSPTSLTLPFKARFRRE